MKLIVFSDTHKNTERMELAVKKENPDAIIHLGDYSSDAIELQRKIPDSVIYMVAGNCDLNTSGKKEILLPIENVKILLTHGHQHNVKTGLSKLAFHAVDLGVSLALYGHTHFADIQTLHGVILMNPGQLELDDVRNPTSYGVIDIQDGKFNCRIEYI